MSKSKKLWLLLRSLLPSKLPESAPEFSAWSDSILELGDLPKNDSFQGAIATMVLHLGPTVGWKAKYFFLVALRKSMANQLAFGVLESIKAREKAARESAIQNSQVQETTAEVV